MRVPVEFLISNFELLHMPVYEYYCPANGLSLEVVHPITATLKTWGEVCDAIGRALGDTPADAAVERLLFAPGVCTPASDSKLKEMGFTKLVRRDSGVYENVTASGGESRYMKADDPSTMPHLKKKISD
jgi:predicted nucleic acid-binding Zn ribbon protein